MRLRTLRIAGVMLSAVLGLMIQSPSAAAASADTDPPMGLMIQVSTLAGAVSPAGLKVWMEDIRTNHHDSARAGFVTTLVLQDIADANGVLYTSYLDVLAPYLPGGASATFSKVYVGTADLRWTGSGSKYIAGIENSAFQDLNLGVSRRASAAFTARYPRAVIDWYITYEANLSGFWNTNVEAAYRSYIVRLMSTLSAIRPHRAFLWSPAFWTSYADEPSWATPQLGANLTDLFTNVSVPLTLDVQDFVGQSGGRSSPATAAAWVKYLKRSWSRNLASAQINAEQFTVSSDGSITAGNATELSDRLKYYVSQNISLGAAWEIRFWHRRVYGR